MCMYYTVNILHFLDGLLYSLLFMVKVNRKSILHVLEARGEITKKSPFIYQLPEK